MTEKLYEQDSMLKSCLATVQSCEETSAVMPSFWTGQSFSRRAAVS